MHNLLLNLLLFFLPLLIIPVGASPFESPKIITALFGMELFAIVIFYKNLLPEANTVSKPVIISLAILFLLSLLHILLFGVNTVFFGNIFRQQGIFLLWHLIVFSVLSSKIQFSINVKWPLICFALISILSFFILPNQNGRIISTIGEPNSLALVLVFLWPLFYFDKGLAEKKIYLWLLYISAFVLIVLTGSKSGLVAFLLQSLFIFGIYKIKLPVLKTALVSLILLAMTLFLPFIQPEKQLEDRGRIWKTGIISGLNRPLFGFGFGNINYALDKTSRENGNLLDFVEIDSSHNILLDFFVSGGLIGLIAIMLLISSVFSNFIRSNNTLALVLFIGVLTCSLFNPLNINGLIYFWFLIGRGIRKN